jgi:hypothetical protein
MNSASLNPTRGRVFVYGPGSVPYKMMFLKREFKGTNKLEDADLVCFTGGEDVTPSWYGETSLRGTHFDTGRDLDDKYIYDLCVSGGTPMVGICRGGQFLNVMNGGRMWQHVDNHGRYHELTDLETGTIHSVSSTHHQMMRPSLEATLVAIAHESTKKIAAKDWWMYNVADNVRPKNFVREDYDTEVVWYEKTKCLCFQPHPEFGAGYARSSEAGDKCGESYFFELLKRYFKMGD